jgi:IS5 family transposase
MGVERMLPMPIAQQCFGPSDEGAEDALFDRQAIRGIVGIELNRDAVLEATTLPKFRHLLDEPKLTERIFAAINVHRGIKGLMPKEGKLIDIEKGDLRNIWRAGRRGGFNNNMHRQCLTR